MFKNIRCLFLVLLLLFIFFLSSFSYGDIVSMNVHKKKHKEKIKKKWTNGKMYSMNFIKMHKYALYVFYDKLY